MAVPGGILAGLASKNYVEISTPGSTVGGVMGGGVMGIHPFPTLGIDNLLIFVLNFR